MAPILTIAIPTYNRPEQIQRQVRLLLPQLDECVHLIVYDNHSDTPVSSFFTEDELSAFSVVRNVANVGADANIARCFEHCSSKWLWTLSDDDYVKSDAVRTLLNCLKNRENYLFFCFWGRQNRELSNHTELCRSLNTLTSFSAAFTMSLCVYNMGLLKPYLRFYYENLTSMVGTLILVVKYSEQHPNVQCAFSDVGLIDEFDPNVHWNYLKFIRQSQLFLYALDPKYKKFYDKTINRGYYCTNYYLIDINRMTSSVGYWARIMCLFGVIQKQGCFNVLKHNPRGVIRLVAKVILNRS